MEIYKIKHKPTGLYYQPVNRTYTWNKTNLSKKGKIYQGGANGLSGKSDTITITISEKQYKSNKELFERLGVYSYSGEYHIRCPKSDFEKEYISM